MPPQAGFQVERATEGRILQGSEEAGQAMNTDDANLGVEPAYTCGGQNNW
jgi:hypothetical protein